MSSKENLSVTYVDDYQSKGELELKKKRIKVLQSPKKSPSKMSLVQSAGRHSNLRNSRSNNT